MDFRSYEGLRETGAFPLDAATAAKIKDDPMSMIGKAVALVAGSGKPMVGYGVAEGSPILGIVEKCEPSEEFSTGSAAGDWTVTVKWGSTFENIVTPDSKTAIEAKYLACNDKGEVITFATATNARCMALNSNVSPKTCIIKID